MKPLVCYFVPKTRSNRLLLHSEERGWYHAYGREVSPVKMQVLFLSGGIETTRVCGPFPTKEAAYEDCIEVLRKWMDKQ